MTAVLANQHGAARMRLCVIGSMRLERGDVAIPIPGQTCRALLGYLALEHRQQERRTRLAGLLWPDMPEISARQNLRQTLYELRNALQPDVTDLLGSDRERIWLDLSDVALDYLDLLNALSRDDIPDRLFTTPQIADRLLDDAALGSPGFDAWLRLTRRSFEENLGDGLTRLMTGTEGPQHIRAAKALLMLDPTDERAARAVMRNAAAMGDMAGAIRAYDDLWTRLEDGFDMEPSRETQDLVAAIKLDELPSAAPVKLAMTPASLDRPTVLVDCLADRQDETRLLDRLRDDLIACLCRFRGLRVIDADTQHARADFRLRMTARQGRDQLELTGRLTSLSDGEVVWSYRTEHALRDWLDLRPRIASTIAGNCDISLSRRRLAEVGAHGQDASAFAAWLRGQDLLDMFRPDAWREAEAAFELATRIAPGFSLAHGALAQVCNTRHLVFPGVQPEQPTSLAALDHANRAVSADPFDARAHLARAWSCLLLHRWPDGEASFALAQTSNPDDPWTVISTALGMAFLGQRETAAALADRYLQEGWTTSRSAWGYHANIRYLAGDLTGCLNACDNAQDGILNLPAWGAAAAAELGHLDAAAERWGRFEASARDHWAGSASPTTETILTWFQRLFPIRDPEDRERLADNAKLAAKAYGSA